MQANIEFTRLTLPYCSNLLSNQCFRRRARHWTRHRASPCPRSDSARVAQIFFYTPGNMNMHVPVSNGRTCSEGVSCTAWRTAGDPSSAPSLKLVMSSQDRRVPVVMPGDAGDLRPASQCSQYTTQCGSALQANVCALFFACVTRLWSVIKNVREDTLSAFSTTQSEPPPPQWSKPCVSYGAAACSASSLHPVHVVASRGLAHSTLPHIATAASFAASLLSPPLPCAANVDVTSAM